MTQRALVERETSPGLDPYGRPLPGVWGTLYEALPCKFWVRSDRELVSGSQTAVIQDARLVVPKVDLDVRDRIAVIRDRQGNDVVPGPLLIDGKEIRADHDELVVRSIS